MLFADSWIDRLTIAAAVSLGDLEGRLSIIGKRGTCVAVSQTERIQCALAEAEENTMHDPFSTRHARCEGVWFQPFLAPLSVHLGAKLQTVSL